MRGDCVPAPAPHRGEGPRGLIVGGLFLRCRRSISRLRAEQPLQESRIDNSPKPDFAVKRNDGHLGIVLGRQVAIAVDIDFLNREPIAPLSVFEHVKCFVAATALRTRVERDAEILQPRRSRNDS